METNASEIKKECLNNLFQISLIKKINNDAGTCLLIHSPDFPHVSHITLHTNNGYKPVDVGLIYQMKI